jgi:LPS-assembly protein
LEPRLYYLRVPYKDQSQIWNFDSALADFDMSRIYGENLFTGRDRIAEANQLTSGVTSRVLSESTGEELFQATVAQRHYFSDQRVTLPNGQINTQRKSDLLVSASGRVAQNIWIDTSGQYNFDTSRLVRTDTSIRWQPQARKVINVGYRRNRTSSAPTQTVYASAQWPVKWISPNLYGVAKVNYDLEAHRLSDALVGWEYAKDCWVWSALVKRSVSGDGRYNNSYYMQLELKGFAGLGNNPTEVLNENITGYQPARFVDEPETTQRKRNDR